MSIEKIERDDTHPAFWCQFVPPKSNVARLVQMPAHQIDGYLLADAYMRDERARRTALEDKP